MLIENLIFSLQGRCDQTCWLKLSSILFWFTHKYITEAKSSCSSSPRILSDFHYRQQSPDEIFFFVVLIWNPVWVALSQHCRLWAFSLCFAGESVQRATGVLVHRARSGPCNPITQSEKETGNAKHWATTRAGLCMYLWVWCIISNKEWHVRLMSRPSARLGGFGYVFYTNMANIAGTDVIH